MNTFYKYTPIVGYIILFLTLGLSSCIRYYEEQEEDKSLPKSLIGTAHEPINSKQTFSECSLLIDVSNELISYKNEELNGISYYGTIGVYKSGRSEVTLLGSFFYITDLSISSDHRWATFDLHFADRKGRMKVAKGNKMTLNNDNTLEVSFNKLFPYNKSYTFIIECNTLLGDIQSNDISEDSFSFTSLLNPKSIPGDRFMSDLFAKSYKGLLIAFVIGLLYFVFNGAWSQLKSFLFLTIVALFSMFHDWTLAIAYIIPMYISVLLLLLPYIRRWAMNIFVILSICSFLLLVINLWNKCGFFLFVWKGLYMSVGNFIAFAFAIGIFEGRCSSCGRFIKGNCRKRKEYHAAESICRIPLNSKGEPYTDPKNLISDSKEENINVCYWCTK